MVDFDAAFERAGIRRKVTGDQPWDGSWGTVRELVTAFEKVYGSTIRKRDSGPRPGDVAGSFCNADTAWRLLKWKAELSIEAGIRDALKWGEVRESILHFD